MAGCLQLWNLESSVATDVPDAPASECIADDWMLASQTSHSKSRSVTIHKTTHLTTTGTILHGVAHVTSVVNESAPSSSHAACTAPLTPANAPKPRRIASVEVDLSKIPGFDAHVGRNRAGKDQEEANGGASGSSHSRTPSLTRPLARASSKEASLVVLSVPVPCP